MKRVLSVLGSGTCIKALLRLYESSMKVLLMLPLRLCSEKRVLSVLGRHLESVPQSKSIVGLARGLL